MSQYVLVGIGGLIGSLLRFLITQQYASSSFSFTPVVAANLIGSLLMGSLLAIGTPRIAPSIFVFLVPGLLGGFTTFSAFSGEAVLLLLDHRYVSLSLYLSITVLGGIAICFASFWVTKIIAS